MEKPATGEDCAKALERLMARDQYSPDSLIEILHAAQEMLGYLPSSALKQIARGLKLPPSRVLGVASFYHLFRFEPCKAHTAVVCLGTACYAAGGSTLMADLQQRLGASAGWTIESGRCIGSCGLAPIVLVDGEEAVRTNPERILQRTKLAEEKRQ
jgi:bidirectional [NiFe] hydrogenase diaphorase subunit